MSDVLTYCLDCIRRRLFPGCAVAFGGSGEEPHCIFAGTLSYQKSPPVDSGTWFDLASLTKPLATTTAALRMTHRGVLDPERAISDFFPHIRLRGARVHHLLSHSSGLPGYVPFYKTCRSGEEVIDRILATEEEFEAGAKSVYSDLGFMLLGRILEIAGGRPYRDLIRHEVLEPLGVKEMCFGPLEPARPTAPTELDFRLHGFAAGIVHDDNARLFGGAAGHAGLFATLPEAARYCRRLLGAALGQNDPELPAGTLKSWIRRQPWLPNSSWGFGWDTPTPESSAGPAIGPNSFGHTGFTGTSVWIDPDQDLYVCILSNRVHPSRHTEGMKKARRQIHALSADELRKRT